MAINIKDPDTDAKARELARLTGEGLTEAVRVAIEQRLARESLRGRAGIAEHLLALAARFGNRKRLFPGSADEAAYVRFGRLRSSGAAQLRRLHELCVGAREW